MEWYDGLDFVTMKELPHATQLYFFPTLPIWPLSFILRQVSGAHLIF
jgi:hypothetical protein